MEAAKTSKGKRRKPYVPAAERFALKAKLAKEGTQTPAGASAPPRNSGFRPTQSQPISNPSTKSSSAVQPHQHVAATGGAVSTSSGNTDHRTSNSATRAPDADGRARVGGAVRASGSVAHAAVKSLDPVVPSVIQPGRKAYGGMGLARPSVMLLLGSRGFSERFAELFDEHVDGFTGKAFAKARNRESSQGMLWRVKLREKHADPTLRTATAGSDAGGPAVSTPAGAAHNIKRPHTAPKQGGTGGVASAAGSGTGALSRKSKSRSKQWLLDAVALQRAANPKVQVDEAQRLRAIALYRMQQKQKKMKGREAGRRAGT